MLSCPRPFQSTPNELTCLRVDDKPYRGMLRYKTGGSQTLAGLVELLSDCVSTKRAASCKHKECTGSCGSGWRPWRTGVVLAIHLR